MSSTPIISRLPGHAKLWQYEGTKKRTLTYRSKDASQILLAHGNLWIAGMCLLKQLIGYESMSYEITPSKREHCEKVVLHV